MFSFSVNSVSRALNKGRKYTGVIEDKRGFVDRSILFRGFQIEVFSLYPSVNNRLFFLVSSELPTCRRATGLL